MGTIQATHVGDRLSAGDAVIERAATVNLAPIKKRHTAFVAIHRVYSTADAAVKKAKAAVLAQQGIVGERDVDQDAALNALAAALPVDGFPRTSPFKPLGFEPPSTIQDLGDAAEARVALKLVAAVRKRKGLSRGTVDAATRLEKAARAVLAAAEPVPGLQKNLALAVARRDALAQRWSNAFAAMKRAARVAEDDGAKGLFDALFGTASASPKKGSGARSTGTKGAPKAPSDTDGASGASGTA